MPTENERVREILAQVKKLAIEFYGLTKKPLGVTGEVAEYAAADLLGLTLSGARNIGHDAICPKTKYKIQIKGRAVSSPYRASLKLSRIKLDADCDRVLLVLLDVTSLNPIEMWEASFESVKDRLAVPGAGRQRGALSIGEFKKLPGCYIAWSQSTRVALRKIEC